MSLYPVWSDSGQDDLLTLVRNEGHPSADHEWEIFAEALVEAADAEGVIRPNALRPLLRGKVAPRRIGAFTNRALASGLVEYTGHWQVSDDNEGRNGGKPMRIMRLVGADL
jgi:hypothetical protein